MKIDWCGKGSLRDKSGVHIEVGEHAYHLLSKAIEALRIFGVSFASRHKSVSYLFKSCDSLEEVYRISSPVITQLLGIAHPILRNEASIIVERV
jgi:hypothetical protein